MTQRTTACGGLFAGLDYHRALALVESSASASQILRHRIQEDQAREAIDSYEDAQLLRTLQRLRVDTLLSSTRQVIPPSLPGRTSPAAIGPALAGFSYAEALCHLLSHPATHSALQRRLLEDGERDPVDCLNEAEVLCALQQLRAEGAVLPAAA